MARYNTISTTSSVAGGSTISTPNSGLLTTLTGSGTVTIPNPVLYTGQTQSFYNSTGSAITLSATPAYINGPGIAATSTSVSLPAGSIITLISDGTNYETLGWVGGAVAITGGSINGATIGAGTASSGAFTTLNASSTTSLASLSATSGTFSSTLGVTGVTSVTNASSVTLGTAATGALQVTGGVGIAGGLYAAATSSFGASLGIGINSPARTLHVFTPTGQGIAAFEASASGLVIQDNSGANGQVEIVGYKSSDSSYHDVLIRADISGLIIKKTTANVGIGTLTPQGKLSISNGGAEGIEFFPAASSNVNTTQHYNRSGSVYVRNRNIALDYTFNLSGAGSDAMVLDTSGNLTVATGNITATSGNVITASQNQHQATALTRGNIESTLNMDFAKSRKVDSRITFSRGSIATYYDATGTVQYAVNNQPRIDYNPTTNECLGLLIEESRTNVLTYTNFLAQVSYSPSYLSSVIPNAALAPDGTYSATKITESTANQRHEFYTNYISVTAGQLYTFSVYVKSAGRNFVAPAYSGSPISNFNLSTGTVDGSSGSITPSIQALPNGWYRCSITVTAPTTTSVIGYICIISSSNGGGVQTYAGDGISGLYIWGIQWESYNFPSTYIPSQTIFNSRASSGSYVDSTGLVRFAPLNTARYGYSYNATTGLMAPQGLILEAAATNLQLWQPYSLNGWYLTGTGATFNYPSVSAPDGSYTVTQLDQTSVATPNISTTVLFSTSGVTYLTYSLYVKAYGSANVITLWIDKGDGSIGLTTQFQLSTLSVASAVTSSSRGGCTYYTSTIVPQANGWYRLSMTATGTFPANAQLRVYVAQSNFGNNSDGYGTATGTTQSGSGAYVWGFQAESGNYPTSFIQTYGASATRAADSSTSTQTTRAQELVQILGSNFSSWYNPTASTVYVESDILGLENNANYAQDIFSFGINGSETGAMASGVNTQTGVNAISRAGFGGASTGYTVVPNTKFKTAMSFIPSTGAITGSNNGLTAVTANYGSLTYQDSLTLGNSPNVPSRTLNGHIYKLTYWPAVLSATTLAALTT